jgi:hypothetical protein
MIPMVVTFAAPLVAEYSALPSGGQEASIEAILMEALAPEAICQGE